jgi:bacillithiol biosynthesis cysteine-adding enzyme BshC
MGVKLLKAVPLSEVNFVPELAKSFLNGNADVKHLYTFKFSIENIKAAIQQKEKAATNRNVLVEILTKQYADVRKSPAVNKNIELLKQTNTFTITAAHQPCLFLGPLYNLIKISATIAAAQKCKEQYPDYNFVPVFWLGSEDHDKDELGHTYLAKDKLEWQTDQAGAIGKFKLGGIENILDTFIQTNSIAIPLSDLIKEAMAKNKDFGKLTQTLVHEIFQAFGLVVIDQNEKEFKRIFSAVIEDEIKNSRAIAELNENTSWLETHYHAQAKPREINFFHLKENSRERILKSAGKYLTTTGDIIGDDAKIASIIKDNPEQFSPNVITRPLFQEIILPNICFVGGSAEISYWLEQKPLFDYYKVAFPMLAHRPIVFPARKNQLQKLEKLGLDLTDLLSEKSKVLNEWVNKNTTTVLDTSAEKEVIAKTFQTLVERAITIDKTLESSIKSELQKAINSLDNIQAKMTKAEKRNHETSVSQINNLFDAFFPDGVLYERRENSIAFFSKLSETDFTDFVNLMSPLHESLIFIEIE